jgi:hypothetical protein
MQRITIVLDEKILLKLRQTQARKIIKTNKAVSLSSIINETLERGIEY